MSPTLCDMLMSAPVRLRSFGIDCRFGGLIHWRELLAVLHHRPEPFSDYLLSCRHYAVHLVGLRRSLVRYNWYSCIGAVRAALRRLSEKPASNRARTPAREQHRDVRAAIRYLNH